jgi:hypothetical protein
MKAKKFKNNISKINLSSMVKQEVVYKHIDRKRFIKALNSINSNMIELQSYARKNGYPSLTVRHVLYGRLKSLIPVDIWELFQKFVDLKVAQFNNKEITDGQEHTC